MVLAASGWSENPSLLMLMCSANVLSEGQLDRETIRLWAGGKGIWRRRLTKTGE